MSFVKINIEIKMHSLVMQENLKWLAFEKIGRQRLKEVLAFESLLETFNILVTQSYRPVIRLLLY